MKVDLTFNNYFKYYLFHLGAKELSPKHQRMAKIATVALAIFTAGIALLVSYAFFYDRNFKPLQVSPGPVPGPVPGAKPAKGPLDSVSIHVDLVEIEVQVCENIADLSHDAIVNAANTGLAPGSGVCGAIYGAGGQAIFDECQQYLKGKGVAALDEGEAMITGPGKLKAKHVIHAVGPVWKKSDEVQDKKRLYDAYTNSLLLAHSHHLTSIAFPSISTGIFGFPMDKAVPIAMQAMTDFAKKYPQTTVTKITFALWENTFPVYRDALMKMDGVKHPKNAAPNDLLLPFYRGEGVDSEGRKSGFNIGVLWSPI